MLTEAEKRNREHGMMFWLVGLEPGVLAVVQRSPLGRTLGRERMFFNLERAVASYQAPAIARDAGSTRPFPRPQAAAACYRASRQLRVQSEHRHTRPRQAAFFEADQSSSTTAAVPFILPAFPPPSPFPPGLPAGPRPPRPRPLGRIVNEKRPDTDARGCCRNQSERTRHM